MVLFQQSFVIEFENGNSNPGTGAIDYTLTIKNCEKPSIVSFTNLIH